MKVIGKIGLIWTAMLCIRCCVYACYDINAWPLAAVSVMILVIGIAAFVADKKGGEINGEEDN